MWEGVAVGVVQLNGDNENVIDWSSGVSESLQDGGSLPFITVKNEKEN